MCVRERGEKRERGRERERYMYIYIFTYDIQDAMRGGRE